MSPKKKILVAAGSSGGHIFPAVSFIEALKESYPEIEVLLLLPRENILKDKTGIPCPVKYLSVPVLSLKFNLHNLKGLLKLFNACLEAMAVNIKFKPDLVVGFGSLICIPIVLCAWLFRVKTIIHEQNVIPGKANKFLSLFCDKIAISFKETEKYLRFKRKLVYTGNPIRRSLIKIEKNKALEFFGLAEDKFTILVFGGSQGSQHINEDFFKFVATKDIRERLQVIHLSGEKDYAQLNQDYANLGAKARVFPFLDAISYAYSAADLILSRAGAGTIAEITYFRIPAIIVPYPHAHGHQIANARILGQHGTARLIEDSQFNASVLEKVLVPLIEETGKLEIMRRGYDSFIQGDAAKNLASMVMANEESHA